jgi:hypothetical protein
MILSFLENSWNYAVTFLRMRFGEHVLASGSGFFWKAAGRTFLVSNLHNFIGRDPVTRILLSPSGGIPDRVVLTVFRRISDTNTEGFYELGLAEAEIPLFQGGESKPVWTVHPTAGDSVDVAAIDVSVLLNHPGVMIEHANQLEGDADIDPFVSQDVFVIGYPLGIIAADVPIPVWKRASIATDPALDPGNKPLIYIDTATRPGMSGSVVLARHHITGTYKTKDGTSSSVISAKRDQILGIYSGRLDPDQVLAQIGIVWKRRLIDEVINAAVKAFGDGAA